MASTNIKSVSNGVVWTQTGNGVPDHIAIIGTSYIDLDTVTEYLNDNGIASWKRNTDSPVEPDIYTTGTTRIDDIVYFNRNDSLSAYTSNVGLSEDNHRLLINNSSTGVISFSGLSIASNTTFNVAPVIGQIIDNESDPSNPIIQKISFSGQTGITAQFISASTSSFILLTSGNTIIQQTTFPTTAQQRQNIYLGQLGHANLTNIIQVFNEPNVSISTLSQVRDMFSPMHLINDGIICSPNGANLSFNTSSGLLYGLGIGYVNNILTPNSVSLSGQVLTNFAYRTMNGGSGTTTNLIDPTNYDLNGVITPIVGANTSSNQRIFITQTGVIRIQYGQTLYSNLTNAIAGIQTETFTTFSNFKNNAILIGIISVRRNATDLSSISDAKFSFVSKFGELFGGTGGVSTTTLQQAYNNSVSPEIITDLTLGPLSIKNGAGTSDSTITLFEGISSGGTITSRIYANGDVSFSGSVSGTSFIKSGGTSSQALLANGAILNNPTSGIGISGQIPYWNSSSSLSGSTNLTWDGTNINLGNINGLVLSSSGTNRDLRFFGFTSVDNFGGASFYPYSGVDVGSSFSLIPKGNGYSSTIKSQITVFNTDRITNPTNYEYMTIRAGGASFAMATGKIGTGVLRPLLLSSGYGDSSTNPNQLWLYTDGRVGINNATNNSVDQLQVNGSLVATTIKKSGGTSSQFLKADGSVDTNPAQIRLSASTNISTLTTDASGFGQNGRNVIIDNTTGITFTTSATSETNFVASYLKHGTTSVTFSAGAGTTLAQVSGTNIMNGTSGSTATISRVDNVFYLRISNV